MFYIYEIRNIITDYVYIGRTANPIKRFQGHQSKLFTGTHFSVPLQLDYDHYGGEILRFRILETLATLEQANDREEQLVRFYMDLFSSYNVMGGGSKGLPRELHPMLGQTHTAETREKISQSRVGQSVGSDNHFYGKSHTAASRELISESRKGKATGGDNPYARRVSVYGIEYGSVREAREAVGMKRYVFAGRLNDPDDPNFKYVE